jgi:hypothetical protein
MRYLSMVLLALYLSASGPAFAESPDAGATPAADTVSAPAPDVVAGPVVVETAPEATAPAATPAPAAEPSKDVTPPGVEDPKVPETNEEVGSLISDLLNAAQNGHWTVFAGLLILLLVWFFNKLGLAAKIGRTYVPWVTLGISTLVAVAIGLSSGAAILDAIKLGVLEGGVAIALWELLFKHLTSKKSDGSPRSGEVAA